MAGVKEVVLLKSLLGGFFKRVTSDNRYIASIQKKINSRPGLKLKFETPKVRFFKRID